VAREVEWERNKKFFGLLSVVCFVTDQRKEKKFNPVWSDIQSLGKSTQFASGSKAWI
jgi:hypothetical protein